MAGKQDSRFAKLASDPRYTLPGKKNAKVGVDKRFSRMFKEDDEDFNRRAKVDKYGRKLKSQPTKEHKSLQNLYREEESDEESDEEEVEISKGAKGRRKIELASASESEDDEADDDDEVQAELERVDAKYDPARDGGFSSSDSDSSDEEEDIEEAELPEENEASKVPLGEVSSRLAIVNLDWDNIRAADIFAVAQSFAPSDGQVVSCAIYPSEFGKERLEREELEGPPKEIFAATKEKSANAVESEDEEEEDDDDEIKKRLQKGDNGEEFDPAALRRYQLDRLRYYYAVLTCSSASTAQAIYTELDGKEYMTTANFFDLRFIPDEVSFDDDKPKEVVKSLPSGYKPNDFVTDALTHSKVKLTWDADDASRKEVQKRAFSRKEVDDNDLQAYIGGSSDSESEAASADEAEENAPKLSKKEAERERMRALLLGAAAAEGKPSKKTTGPVGDMQVTFTSGLSSERDPSRSVFENSPPRDETTVERYVRKERERKARRREKAKAKRAGEDVGSDKDSGDEIGEVSTAPADPSADPFDDPFFNDPVNAPQKTKEKVLKADRLAKRAAREAKEKATAEEREKLEKLMDVGDGMAHFDMKAEAKAAKARKGKKGKTAPAVVEEKIETADPRFAALYESHEYAIDPTNPRFSKTEGMKALLEEGRKRRRDRIEGEERSSKKQAVEAEDDTQKLLARVKARGRK